MFLCLLVRLNLLRKKREICLDNPALFLYNENMVEEFEKEVLNLPNINAIRDAVLEAAQLYPVKRVELFGSYADGTANERSDIDFLVEFNQSPISLLKISGFQQTLSELLQLEVDIVEMPLDKNSDLKLNRTVCIYGT